MVHPVTKLPQAPKRSLSTEETMELVDFLDRLMEASRAAILPHFRTRVDTNNKDAEGGFDPVTIADKAGEEAIRGLIETHYPDHGIFGEEYGYKEPEDGLTWVIDPIDGTRAFISGMPTWGTLIGLFDGDTCVLGAMDQPFTQEQFIGSPLGAVARRHGQSTDLKTASTTNLAEATIYSTTPDMFAPGEEQTGFETLSGHCRLQRFGADCYAYAMLAWGQIDLVVESSLKPYDIAAHIPIIEAAGGIVTGWDGGPAHNSSRVLAAANRTLHEKALTILKC